MFSGACVGKIVVRPHNFLKLAPGVQEIFYRPYGAPKLLEKPRKWYLTRRKFSIDPAEPKNYLGSQKNGTYVL